jgi:hypothetical protein
MDDQSNDRVRRSTSDSTNREIDEQILREIDVYLNQNAEAITQRIEGLDREWSIERWLELNASIIAFIGVLLGAFVNIYWLFLPAFVLIFLCQHAIQGWCPPVPIFRSKGVRTRKEIDWEKFALKFLRGDFKQLGPQTQNAKELFEAVKK